MPSAGNACFLTYSSQASSLVFAEALICVPFARLQRDWECLQALAGGATQGVTHMQKGKLYTSSQAFAASFLGGPMAMTYVLWKNFQSLGNIRGERQTIIWGTSFCVVMALIAPFIPSNVPSYLLPILYSAPAKIVVENYQLSKQAILQSDKFEIHSNWNVAVVIVGFLAGFVVLAIAWILVAMQLELITH